MFVGRNKHSLRLAALGHSMPLTTTKLRSPRDFRGPAGDLRFDAKEIGMRDGRARRGTAAVNSGLGLLMRPA